MSLLHVTESVSDKCPGRLSVRLTSNSWMPFASTWAGREAASSLLPPAAALHQATAAPSLVFQARRLEAIRTLKSLSSSSSRLQVPLTASLSPSPPHLKASPPPSPPIQSQPVTWGFCNRALEPLRLRSAEPLPPNSSSTHPTDAGLCVQRGKYFGERVLLCRK